MFSIFLVEGEDCQIELPFIRRLLIIIWVFFGQKVDENIVEFLQVAQIVRAFKKVKRFLELIEEIIVGGGLVVGSDSIVPFRVAVGYLFEGLSETCLFEVHCLVS